MLLAVAVLGTGRASAADETFDDCVARLTGSAVAAGIDEPLAREVLGSVEPLDKVVESDRGQPEFTRSFADYYLRRVTSERVARGRALLEEQHDLLMRAQASSGVPAQYLLSFWGLETNYGAWFGNTPVPAALATLACDGRRGEFFTSELIAALKILQSGDISRDRMLGSWAGAMGHVQFLPSVFLAYAVDADGDGRRDIWGSVPDAIMSAANYLKHLGWQRGLRWGREIRVPAAFDYSLAGQPERQPLSDWVAHGITDAWGRKLPALDLPAAVRVPAGHTGPAFIVYDNFDVIMRWNRSENYALAVGRLADRIAGAGELQVPLPEDGERVTRDEVRQLQSDLSSLGYDAGAVDGAYGPSTRRALSRFQRDQQRVADGYLDADVLRAVRNRAEQLEQAAAEPDPS